MRQFDRLGLRFRHGNEVDDRSVLNKWADGMLPTVLASALLSKYNNWITVLSDKAFEELAHSLGYWRPGELQEWLKGEEK